MCSPYKWCVISTGGVYSLNKWCVICTSGVRSVQILCRCKFRLQSSDGVLVCMMAVQITGFRGTGVCVCLLLLVCLFCLAAV